MPKIIVSQCGARHRYAVPRIFQQMGYLSQLVTDSHADSLLGKIASIASKIPIVPFSPRIRSLKGRKIEEIPQELVFAADAFFWKERQLHFLYEKGAITQWLKARDMAWFSLIQNYVKLDRVDCLYTMGGLDLTLTKEAQKFGVKVIVDAFISPINFQQTLNAKCEIGIEPSIMEINHRDLEVHYKEIFQYSDIILCPSEWVAEGVIALDSKFEPKIHICPYGSSLKFSDSERRRVPGRIFWAGRDWFRKGLHHLAAAADILKPKYPALDFRIAGITDPVITAMPRFRNLNFLGNLDRLAMEHEFCSADLFVLPTLTEGMASVVIEAIASGCPVITTRSAGIDAIEHGRSGLIIDLGKPEILAKEIEALFLDRQYLAAMGKECSKLATYYTEDAWASRLKELVEDIL
jgi:glycosyltransferase involved in cell wall biosynthesis